MLLNLTGREPHPVIPLLDEKDEAELRVRKMDAIIAKFYQKRAQIMFAEKHDPLRFGYELPVWKLIDQQIAELRATFPHGVIHLVILGANRSSKTTHGIRRVVKLAVEKPGARIWCLHETEAASRSVHQSLVFDHLPPEWRPQSGKMRSKYDRTTKIVYTDAGGFTNNLLVLPNGSKIWFKFYGASVDSLEGDEVDFVLADEMIEPDWIEALRFRLLNRNGILMLTFTPVKGYSPTVRMYLDNAITLEETEAELLPEFDGQGNFKCYQKVPRVQQSGIKQARIVYFHTKDNPYGNYEAMKVEVQGNNEERIKMRAYGVATRSESSQFNFNSKVHVITEAEFTEWVKKYPAGTRYHLVDPCSGRNWFMGWAFCPFADKVIWYKEWPSHGHPGAYIEGIGDPGPWATSFNVKPRRDGAQAPSDGERGPAQDPFKFSLKRYVQEIKKVEGDEVIFERWMDSRYGNSPREGEEETTTLIQQMDGLDMVFCAMTGEQKILGVNDGSIDLINSALYYDKSVPIGQYSAELARVNEPQMLVVETCPNLIFALEQWTGKDGMHGACKDGIDVLRGYFLSELGYVGHDNSRQRTGTYGY